MTVTATHAPGTFCWLDLAAHDAEAAKRFYTEFLGWEAVDMPYDENGVYTMYRLDGQDVGASYAMDPNQKAGGMPSTWLQYIAVENADESARRAAELGGTLMMDPFDVLDVGRMALVQDPTGAVFALWQGYRHAGVGVRDQEGALCWNELATPDTGAARAFYRGLFGWEGQEMDVGGQMTYTSFSANGRQVGGMYQLTPEIQMPPCWMPYFAVGDVDASAEKARSLGAQVLMAPQDIPGVGRFALIQDPQGAMFYIFKPLMNPANS